MPLLELSANLVPRENNQPMANPRIVELNHHRIIRIDYPRLFRDREDRQCEEFLRRGFEVEDVVSMEIDRTLGSAFVHLDPRCATVTRVLECLADKLGESRRPVMTPSCSPYFVLQEEGGRIAYARAPDSVTGVRRWLYVGLGAAFFGLSVVGVWAPLVPTTPFVILSSYFALRASPALNERLLRSRLFGRLLRDWHLHRALRRSTKRRVLLFMVLVFALTVGLTEMAGPFPLMALLIALFSFGFVWQLPSVEDEAPVSGRLHQPMPRLALAH